MKNQSKEKVWVDEAGMQLPSNRITKLEKMKEKHASKIAKEAIVVSAKLIDLKETFMQLCDQVFLEAVREYNQKITQKGNFTWYNFDRSIKVEVSISERIDFDDLTIKAAKEKLEDFLNESIDVKIDFAKELVVDAFSTSRGKLDAKKVLGLLKYKGKIQHQVFQDAMKLIEESIRRPDSRTYYRVFVRNTEGGYDNVELNFSSI